MFQLVPAPEKPNPKKMEHPNSQRKNAKTVEDSETVRPILEKIDAISASPPPPKPPHGGPHRRGDTDEAHLGASDSSVAGRSGWE